MLMIIMHNRQDYLDSLTLLAKKEGIADATVIKKKDIGIHLIGESGSFTSHEGSLFSAYDKAFVAVVKDYKKAKQLLNLIENDPALRLLNLNDKGFICTVPFWQIKHLELESSHIKGRSLR